MILFQLLILISLILSACAGATGEVSGTVVNRHALSGEEILAWDTTASCLYDNGVVLALVVPRVDEIVIRESISCGGVDAVACTGEGEISILDDFWHDGEPDDTYWELLRHEEKHWILGLATGDSDRNHTSVWFSADSPCPDREVE